MRVQYLVLSFGLWGCGVGLSPVKTEDSERADSAETESGGSETPIEFSVCLNEFMPDNGATLAGPQGDFPDWLEIHNPGDAPVYLQDWSLSDDPANTRKHVLAQGIAIDEDGYLLLYADGNTDAGIDHLSFSLPAEGGSIGLFTPEGYGNRIEYGDSPADYAIARKSDCCTGPDCLGYVWQGTPGEANAPKVTVPEEVLPAGSTWSYWDRGTAPAAGWNGPGFDSSGWATGVGPLGYGDTHVVTTLGYGADADNKYVTTWFRTTVDLIDDANLEGLRFHLLRDDAAVVYVNGLEVLRSNLPEGDILPETLALASVGDADETTYFELDNPDAELFEGPNVIAVELHQASVTSSDLGFDLALSVLREVEQ